MDEIIECKDFGIRAMSCKSCPHYPNCTNYRYRVSEQYYKYKDENNEVILKLKNPQRGIREWL